MIFSINLQRLLLITLLLVAGLISAVISNVKVPTLVMLLLLLVCLANYKINIRHYVLTVFSVAISHLSIVTIQLSPGVRTIPIFLLDASSASRFSLPFATLCME